MVVAGERWRGRAGDHRVVLVHLDTDLGGDPDDVAALAMLLGHPDVELTAVTTTVDPGGERAGYAGHVLALAGRSEVPVVAGAGTTLTGDLVRPLRGERYWPRPVTPRPAPAGAALDLLAASVRRGATVVAVGPLTNLAAFSAVRPERLEGVRVVVMGGWARPLGPDLPPWGPERDWNVQCDVRAAELVAAGGADLTLVTLADTLRTHLRARDLPLVRAAGPVGELLARQAVAYAADRGHRQLARAHAGLPDDLLLFLHDPLACAVALGWDGVRTEVQHLRTVSTDGLLTWVPDGSAPAARVVTGVDSPGFTAYWLDAVERLAG